MSHRFRTGLFGLAILGLAWSTVGLESLVAEEPALYELRLKFTPGQELHYVSQNDEELLVQFAQAQDTVRHTSMFMRRIRVLGVNPDGSADVQLLLDRAYMTSQNSEVSSLYDSQDPDHVPTEFSSVKLSIGKPLPARLTTRGKFLPAADQPPSFEQQIDLLLQLPEQPISVGGTWKDSYEVAVEAEYEGKLFRQVKMLRRYELKSVDQGIATIAVTTTPITPINDAYQESQLLRRKPIGILKFDLERGCLVDRQVRVDDRVVGNQGPGSALTVKIVKVDRMISADQISRIDMTKPLVPVRVAAAPTTTTK